MFSAHAGQVGGRRAICAALFVLVASPSRLTSQVREDPVRFVVAGDTIAGTLALPAGSGPHPAVVLLSGMLQDTRDAATGNFRTFKVLSDTLAAFGMAVLRYDDRGVGESGGRNTWEYTLEEHAAEATAAMQWLRARPDIDARRVGLLGHSYGGPMAARAARRGGDPAFIVLASPHVLVDRDIITGMVRRQQLAGGRSVEQAAEEVRFLREVYEPAVRGSGDWRDVRQAMQARARPVYDQLPDSVRQRRPFDAFFDGTLYALLLRLGPTTMWRDFWELDLTSDYAAVRAPTLALFGGADGQVVADENVPALQKAMAGGANAALVVSVVPEATHFLRAPRTPRGQFAAGVVDTLVSWLRARGVLQLRVDVRRGAGRSSPSSLHPPRRRTPIGGSESLKRSLPLALRPSEQSALNRGRSTDTGAPVHDALSPSHDSNPRMRSLLLAATLAACFAAALPAQGTSRSPVSASPSSATPRWEHGVYSHWLGGAKRWSAPGGILIEENNLNKFLTALGATQGDLVHKHVSEERYNATVLDLLGRQGWELANCQFVERSSSYLYLCYLKRPVATDRAAGAPTGEARGAPSESSPDRRD